MKNMLISLLTILSINAALLAQDAVCRVDTTHFFEYIPGTNIKELKHRVIYSFDENNNQILMVRDNWILSTSTWENFLKWETTYNIENEVATRVHYVWNLSTNNYDFSERYTFTYDAQNNLTQQLGEYWNASTNAWENAILYTFEYDANNNLLLFLRSGWVSNAWQQVEKTQSTYVNNNRVLFEYFFWNTNAWQFYYTLEESYNSNDQLIETIRKNYNQSTSQLENFERLLYQYDLNGNRTQLIDQSWQEWNNTWDGGQRTLYNYGPNNTPSGSLTQYWNNNTNAYDINVSNVQYTYDAFLNNTIMDTKVWNTGSSSWQNSAKETREFDNNNFMVVYENMWNWIPGNNYYGSHNRTEYVCSLMDVSDIENEALIAIMVYPNPVESNGTITIQVNTAQVYTITDATGKICLSGKLQNGENQVALGALNSGIYFLRTQTGVSKLVVQ